MKVQVNVTAQTLVIENTSADQVNQVITGFFQALGVAAAPTPLQTAYPVQTVAFSPKVAANEPKPVQNTPKTATNVQKPLPNTPKPVENAPKTLPKINDDRSLFVPIGEALQSLKPANTRDFGDGVTGYQAHYWCGCGDEGNRYILPTYKYLKCHVCQTKLSIEPATFDISADGLPEPDNFGNFFVARHEYE